jgi:hypothetical protein
VKDEAALYTLERIVAQVVCLSGEVRLLNFHKPISK